MSRGRLETHVTCFNQHILLVSMSHVMQLDWLEYKRGADDKGHVCQGFMNERDWFNNIIDLSYADALLSIDDNGLGQKLRCLFYRCIHTSGLFHEILEERQRRR